MASLTRLVTKEWQQKELQDNMTIYPDMADKEHDNSTSGQESTHLVMILIRLEISHQSKEYPSYKVKEVISTSSNGKGTTWKL